MAPKPRIHAFIISWEGHGDKARKIAAALKGAVPFLTVIYSNHANADETGPGTWVKVPDDFYYGRKFRACVRRFQGDVMLQIQADADAQDWLQVVRSVETCYSKLLGLEIWCPDIDYSFWETPRVTVGSTFLPGVHLVVQSDGVVWAMTKRSVDRFKEMDFEGNNLGWGIELAAISFALSNKLLVVRDTNVKIDHPKSTGYDVDLAREQQFAFFHSQLNLHEQILCKLVRAYVAVRVQTLAQP